MTPNSIVNGASWAGWDRLGRHGCRVVVWVAMGIGSVVLRGAAAEPQLHISCQAGQVRLAWPMGHPGYQVQSRSALDPSASWVRFSLSPSEEDGSNVVYFPVAAGRRFFRLGPSIHHVLVAGQSLAMGAYAEDLLSTNQPYRNLMFAGQHLDGGNTGFEPDGLTGLVPLREYWDGWQHGGETVASGFANWVSERVGEGGHDLLVSNCARGGSPYDMLRRQPSRQPGVPATGTYPYLRGLAQVQAARELLGAASYQFRAILVVHGESDSTSAIYDQYVRDWQIDYQADIQALTGQTDIIPMFHTQISAWGNLGNATRSSTPYRLLEEYERNPHYTVLVGPKYFLPYRAADGLHLTSEGYRWLGEYYAKAYEQHVIRGIPWQPLRPALNGITRSNNVIEIVLRGAVAPLVLDTNLVTNPEGVIFDAKGSPTYAAANIRIGPYGFEYWDTHGSGIPWQCSTYVTGAEVVGSDRVRVYLNQAPQGSKRRIRYAYTALPRSLGGSGGPVSGPRGNLRDSDPAVSRYGHPLYNWCVHFDKACP